MHIINGLSELNDIVVIDVVLNLLMLEKFV
jgi:hypothetical protein